MLMGFNELFQHLDGESKMKNKRSVVFFAVILFALFVQTSFACPPEAVLTVSPSSVLIGDTVTLDASGSYATAEAGYIAKCEWDFDYVNDTFTADYTTEFTNGSIDMVATHVYDTRGTHTVALRVTDNYTLTDIEATYTVEVKGRVHNITQDQWYGYMQASINAAEANDILEANESTYYENISFQGKRLTLRSKDPNDWNNVSSTIIEPNNLLNAALNFNNHENSCSIFEGITIKNAITGIYCEQASPIIRKCLITANGKNPATTYWKLDEGSGSYAYDSISTKTGTITGASWTTQGKFGKALSFDGNGDYVTFSSTAINTNSATISLWFKTSANFSSNYGSQGFLLNAASNIFQSYLTLCGNGSSPYSLIGETDVQNDYYLSTSGIVPVGQWNHVVVVFQNKIAYTYLNGTLVDTRTITYSALTITRMGGNTGSGYNTYFNGIIDDVRFYTKALSAQNVTDIYNNTEGKRSGIYCDNAAPAISNCLITNNEGDYGAGICNIDSNSIIRNCVIKGNLSDQDGGGVYNEHCSPTIINSTIVDNDANNGGGIFNWGSSSQSIITNCILWDNSSTFDGNEICNGSSASPVLSYCDIKDSNGSGPNWWSRIGQDGGGNIDNDPCFAKQELLVSDLVSRWKLDEGSGSTINDSKGTNNGTAANTSWTTGRLGNALSFNGTSSYISVPDTDNSLDIDNEITITAWIKPNNLSGYYCIAAKQPSGTAANNYPGNYEFRIEQTSGCLKLLHQTSTGNTISAYMSTIAVNVGQWQHVVVTLKEGSSVKFYINGLPAGSFSQTTAFGIANNNPLRIGSRKDSSCWFNGDIDDVQIYKRCLSANEIQEIYTNKSTDKYHLDCNSPCINAGGPFTIYDNELDIDNEPRMTCNVDIGADEVNGLSGIIDFDNDGLTNIEENQLHTDICDADTDDDGLNDYDEVHTYGTNPSVQDTDGDNLPDGWEVQHQQEGFDPLVSNKNIDSDSDQMSDANEYKMGTDPLKADTDGDSLPDGWEYINGLNPLANDAYVDSDGDGYVNCLEYQFGKDPLNKTSKPSGFKLVTPDSNLQQIINDAVDGNVIILEPGTYAAAYPKYNGFDNTTNFNVNNKSLTIRSINPQDPCVVCETILTSLIQGGNPIYTLSVNFTTSSDRILKVEGLTFTGGSSGIYCSGYVSNDNRVPQVDVNHCVFHDNIGYNGRSPAIDVRKTVLHLKNSKFFNNSFSQWGGQGGAVAIDNSDISNLNSNTQTSTISNCIFSANATQYGGAIYLLRAYLVIRDCIFVQNKADYGGAIACGYTGGLQGHFCTIENSLFNNNKGGEEGGAIYCTAYSYEDRVSKLQLKNCTITANESGKKGGAICLRSDYSGVPTDLVIYNSIIFGNKYSGINPADCYGHEIYVYPSYDWNIDIYDSDVKGKDTVTNNFINYDNGTTVVYERSFDTDPCFVNAEIPVGIDGVFGTCDDGLRLHPLSQCIDNGNNTYAPKNEQNQIVDIFGQIVRDMNSFDSKPATRDIGAYECNKNILFVNCNNTSTNQDGLSWSSAYGDLQDAITKALQYSMPVDIWVAHGTYKPDGETGDRALSFKLYPNINLYGGFKGENAEKWTERDIVKYKTILSGDIDESGAADSYHVLKVIDVDSSAGINGFTIQGGNANMQGNEANSVGAGLYCVNSSPLISDCNFVGNNALNYGGGAYVKKSSSAFTNCGFAENTAGLGGGGIAAALFSSPVIRKCSFERNTLTLSVNCGGAILNATGSQMNIFSSVFEDNIAQLGYGGAICNLDSSLLSVNNSAFADNSSSYGGAIFSSDKNLEAKNCVFVKNWKQGYSGWQSKGAIYSASGELVNCTIYGDYSEITFFDALEIGKIKNCIVYGDNEHILNVPASVALEYSDIYGGYPGIGNINVNPYFYDVNSPKGPDGIWFTDDDGLRLCVFDPRVDGMTTYAGSCIDSADCNEVPETDICGNSGVDVPYIPNRNNDADSYADMGAYEMPVVWYVCAYNTSPGIGTSWAYSMNDLQEALAKAKDGEEIWLSKGEYKPGDERTDTFLMNKNIKLFGGFNGYSFNKNSRDWKRNKTILSGNIGTIEDYYNSNLPDNSYHVLSINSSDVYIDGFIIEKGHGDSTNGAGILMQNSNSKISNCIFRYCNAPNGLGNAIYIYNGNPIFDNCTFIDNHSMKSIINDAHANKGGAIYAEKSLPIIKNCLFVKNASNSGLGGAIAFNNSVPTILNCIFQENSAFDNGGALSFSQSLMNLGGSIGHISNCAFIGNMSHNGGGGIYVDGTYSSETQPKDKLYIENCTFATNLTNINSGYHRTRRECGQDLRIPAALSLSYNACAEIVNSIFWSNELRIQKPWLSKISYCDIEGCGGSGSYWNPYFAKGVSWWDGGVKDEGGNIDEYPEFIETPDFCDVGLFEYLIDMQGNAYGIQEAVIIVPDAAKYEIGDVLQVADSNNAKTIVDINYDTNEVIVRPGIYIQNQNLNLPNGVSVKIYDVNGNEKSTDIVRSSSACDQFETWDYTKYEEGYLIEINNDGILREVVYNDYYCYPNSLCANIYFSPNYVDAYNSNFKIINWGKDAIVNLKNTKLITESDCAYDRGDIYSSVTYSYGPNYIISGKKAGLKVSSTQVNSSPCIDKGFDNKVSTFNDVSRVPRIQKLFNDLDANSVDMGAFESGGLVSTEQTILVDEDTPYTFNLSLQNLKGGSISYVIVAGPTHGTLTTSDGISATYTPSSEYSFEEAGINADEFYYKPFDGVNYGETTRVIVQRVTATVNEAPIDVNDTVWFNEDQSEIVLDVLNNDYDPDNAQGQLTVYSHSNGSYGNTTIENNKIKYTLTSGLKDDFLDANSDTFTYVCQNAGMVQSAKPAVVNVKANYRPVRKQSSIEVATEPNVYAVIDAAANYTDRNIGQAIDAAVIVKQPTRGKVVIYKPNPKYILYIPADNSGGPYTFKYKVKDELGLMCDDDSNTTISVTINNTKTIKDTDLDGISDADESETVLGTDSHKSDSDNDGVYDNQEIIQGFDPVDSNVSGYYADTLPYSTCFFPSQGYSVDKSLDGQQGWQVEQGQCNLIYSLLYGDSYYQEYVGCINAQLSKNAIISKAIEDGGVNDGDSNTVIVKLYPTADAEVRILSENTIIAAIKFDESTYKVRYGNNGQFVSSTINWNYNWSGYNPNPDAPDFFGLADRAEYIYNNYALSAKFVFDFSNNQCAIFWANTDTYNYKPDWQQVGVITFGSSISKITKVQFKNGSTHDYYVRGLYINNTLNPNCAITFPQQYTYVKSRIPIKGCCYGTNMSGYQLTFTSQDDQYFAGCFDIGTNVVNSRTGVSDSNGGILGYWNTGMWPDGSYSVAINVDSDICLNSKYNYKALPLSHVESYLGIDTTPTSAAVENIATCGSIKNSVFNYTEEPDISVPWQGLFPFELRRSYSSTRRYQQWPSLPGAAGWTDNLQITLTEYAEYYESSTCSNKVGGEVADKDASGLAFGAIYVQYEDGSIHLFRHTTGSVDTYYSTYVPYPQDNSGDFIKRIVTGDVNATFIPLYDTPSGVAISSGNGFSVDYELHRADGSQTIFDTKGDIVSYILLGTPCDRIEHLQAMRIPYDCNYGLMEDVGGFLEWREHPYHPYGGAVFTRLMFGGYHDYDQGPGESYRWIFNKPDLIHGMYWLQYPYNLDYEDRQPLDNWYDITQKWRIKASIKTKTDRLGNTLYYGSNDETGDVNWVSTSLSGPQAAEGTTILLGNPDNGYWSTLVNKAKLIINGVTDHNVCYLIDPGVSNGQSYSHFLMEVCNEDKNGTRSNYRSYAYTDTEKGLLRGIFNGKLLDTSYTPDNVNYYGAKEWDWPKRTTIIGYDSWNNFVERIDYIDTEKDNDNYKLQITSSDQMTGQDYSYVSLGYKVMYRPITAGDNYLYHYYWWFFTDADSGNNEDGQTVFNLTDYYRPQDIFPYREDCTIVNEKGQLKTAGNFCFLDYLFLPKITEYDYENVDLPFTPSRVKDSWLDYDCLSDTFEIKGKRVDTEYEKRELVFGDNEPNAVIYDLVTQKVYDPNNDVNTTIEGMADDYLVGYQEITYHDYNGLDLQTSMLSYQQLDKTGTAHTKPVRTNLVYAQRLSDGSYQVNESDPNKNIYLWKKQTLLNAAGNKWAETVYTYNDDNLLETERDPNKNVKYYTYDDNLHLQLLEAAHSDEDEVPIERYYYDALGRLLLKADTQGLVTRYDYIDLNIQKVRTYRDPDALYASSFEPQDYDSIDANSTTIYEYDNQSRVISERSFSSEDKLQQGVADELVYTSIKSNEYLTSNQISKVTIGKITKFDTIETWINNQQIIRYEPNIATIDDYSIVDYGYDGRGLKIWEKNTDALTSEWWHNDYYYNSLDKVTGTIWSDYQDRNILRSMRTEYHGSGNKAFELLFGANADGTWELQKAVDTRFDSMDRVKQQTVSISVDKYFVPIEAATTYLYYDDVGNQICAKDPKGNCIFADFDNANRQVKQYFATPFNASLANTKASAVVSKLTKYFANGQVQDVNSYDYTAGKLLAKSSFEYDCRGRMTDVIQAVTINNSNVVTDSATTTYDYNDAFHGFIVDGVKYAGVHVTDAVGKKNSMVNNQQGKPIYSCYPSGKYEKVRYNGDGTVKQKLVFNSSGYERWIGYTYDELNRLSAITYPDSAGNLAYTYNGLGQVTQIRDNRAAIDNIGGNGTLTYEYDTLGQLISYFQQDGYRIDYSYHADGQKQTIEVYNPGVLTQDLAYQVKYYFDTAGRLKYVTEPMKGNSSQYTAGFDYDLNGNRTGLDYYLAGSLNASKVGMDYTYNNDNMLTAYSTSASGVTAPTFSFNASASTKIDGLGRLKAANETITKPDNSTIAYVLDFSYDSLSQLTFSSIYNGTRYWRTNYVYQKNGDMSSRTTNRVPISFTYTGNEMAAVGASTLGYDLNGNQTAGLKDASTSMNLEYNWDNKLQSAVAGANTIDIKYDPAGNRIYKSSVGSLSSAARKYIIDVVGDLPVILMEIDPANSSIEKFYIYANAEILSEHDGGYNATQYYYLHDRLGSVREVLNSSGAVVKMFTFNPFGETIEDYGSYYTPWQFTGQYLDSETNMYYLRARQYSPYLSRFTGRDLIVGQFENPLTLHKYLYCGNNPINMVDLTGLWGGDTHREFGNYGYSYFDYGRLDVDMPATDLLHYKEYAPAHFMSKEQSLPWILMSIAMGNSTGFEYSVHAWQDSYVHYDQGFRWETMGHAEDSFWKIIKGMKDQDVDSVKNAWNITHQCYDRADKTTERFEDIWFEFQKSGYASDKFSSFTKWNALENLMSYGNNDLWIDGKYIVDY
jgi:RHS repeat-associated protein